MSISINHHQNMHSLFATNNTKNVEAHSSIESKPVAEPKVSSLQEIKRSRNISNIKPEEIKTHYDRIKAAAAKELESSNFSGRKLEPYDYHDATIDKIMTDPLEVKIDRDEVNTAIIYNRLGISFLDIKRLEVRMEILNLAQDEVNKSEKGGSLRRDQAQALTDKINDNLSQLEDKKKSIIERRNGEETDELFLEQVSAQRKMIL